jgi:hypothetical protein
MKSLCVRTIPQLVVITNQCSFMHGQSAGQAVRGCAQLWRVAYRVRSTDHDRESTHTCHCPLHDHSLE